MQVQKSSWLDRTKDFSKLLVIALPVIGLLYYLGIRWAYMGFYERFYIVPEMVGLGYIETLARSAIPFLTIVGSVGFLVGSVLLAAGNLIHWRKDLLRKLTIPVLLLIVVIVLGFSVKAARDRAVAQADLVVAGGAINTFSPGFLGIVAEPACVYWTGQPGKSPIDDAVDGGDFVYLGEADGRVVLFDDALYRTLLLPVGDTAITLGFVCA